MLRKTLAALVFAALPASVATAQTTQVVIDVVKNAACGCCEGWIVRMQEEGFTLNSQDLSGEELYDIKVSRGLSTELMACHTATVAGYTVEGHVPAREIRRLLAELPDAIGIATPGMPLGSPGMDPIGAPSMGFSADDVEPYDVLLVLNDGTTEVYASYGGA